MTNVKIKDEQFLEDEEMRTRRSNGRDENQVLVAKLEGYIIKWVQEVCAMSSMCCAEIRVKTTLD